jgi:hypothetical protein
MITETTKQLFAASVGILIGALIATLLLGEGGMTEKITHADNEEVHVHADFLMYLNDKKIDLTKDKYQSTSEHLEHDDFHLHDHEGNILHRHDQGITFPSFLKSIGFVLTPTCITTDEGEKLCADDKNELSLYVNGESLSKPGEYVIDDEDRVLLYYGEMDSPDLQTYLSEITDEACIYSGTCPERGSPPPESCGLTCDI